MLDLVEFKFYMFPSRLLHFDDVNEHRMKKPLRGTKLTSKEVARLLGVSEASVKRWADSGLLAAEKTAGGHRRFRPEDVAVFRRAGMSDESPRAVLRQTAVAKIKQIAKPDAAFVNEDNAAALVEEMYGSLLGARDEEAAALLVNLYLHGHGVAALADAVLLPPLKKIGDLWRRGELSVAQEHIATQTAIAALRALRAATGLPVTNSRLAICCSTEEDFHELPVHVAALTLEAAGWNIVELGASTPFSALAELIERYRPRLVCVASAILNNLDRAAREYESFRKAAQQAQALIVLGGEGFSATEIRAQFPADLHADNFRQLAAFAAEHIV